jgi:hypothetical protein
MKVKIGKYPKSRWYDNYIHKWFGYISEQKVSVQIDPWDTWSMDHTLAHIVLPMLYQLATTKNCSAEVDAEDVPEALRGDTSEDWNLVHARWDYCLAEMIYAFEHKVNGEDLHMRFDYSTQKKELEREYKRIQNGFFLFGKYYECLWD